MPKPEIFAVVVLVLASVGMLIGSVFFPPGVKKNGPLPQSFAEVDQNAWEKTLAAIEQSYADACNRTLVLAYRGNRDEGFDGYVCIPIRGSVVVKRNGKFLASGKVVFPWESHRDAAGVGGSMAWEVH